MKKISKLEFYNTPKKSKLIEFNLDTTKQFFIFTGFNGAGKSRMIKIIHETFSALRNKKFDSSVSRWSFQCTLSDGARVRGLKMEQGAATKEEINSIFSDLFVLETSLENAFNKAASLVDREIHAQFSNSDKENKIERFTGGGMILPTEILQGRTAEDYANDLNMIAYIDEEIYYNSPEKVVNSIIKGEQPDNTLDKTLASLMHDFVIERANADEFKQKVAELLNLSERTKKGLTKDKLKEAIEIAMMEMGPQKNFENNAVFEELNGFYKMTNRKIIWFENAIHMSVPDEGIIPFNKFSKGEKTLLALLLTVFLNRDNAFFLLDEPDLSLHVEWQERLLPALQRLAPNAQFIIATHSPFLIMNTQSEEVVNLAKVYKEHRV